MASLFRVEQQNNGTFPELQSFIVNSEANQTERLHFVVQGPQGPRNYLALVQDSKLPKKSNFTNGTITSNSTQKIFAIWQEFDKGMPALKYMENLNEKQGLAISSFHRVDVCQKSVLFHFLNPQKAVSCFSLHDASKNFQLLAIIDIRLGKNAFSFEDQSYYTTIFTIRPNPSVAATATMLALYHVQDPKTAITYCNLTRLFEHTGFRCYQTHVYGGKVYFALAEEELIEGEIICKAAILSFDMTTQEFSSLGRGLINPIFFKNRVIQFGHSHRIDGTFFENEQGYQIKILDLENLIPLKSNAEGSKNGACYRMQERIKKTNASGDWFLTLDKENSKIIALTHIFPENVTWKEITEEIPIS